ncbi:MAG: MBL fold metallo-hydrolase [Opitutales bacterium]|nr:MBL fold metallo-hydrolase [Opitutales bacterium]MCH8540960.1 MBL fold metallo-hydrolase [Opitutales bacterium]
MPNDPTLHPELERYRKPLEPRIIETRAGIYTVRGVSLANCHFVRGNDGLVVVDSGSSLQEGRELRRLIRTVSEEPVRAVLLTHSHYSGGLGGLLEKELEEKQEVAIVGHPRIPVNLQKSRDLAKEVWAYRVSLENGSRLPREGEGAIHAPARAWRDGRAFCDLTHALWPGTEVELAGLPMRTEKGFFDTDDGLAFRFPSLDLIAHNLVTDQFPNFGSLGGDRYRDPLPWLEAVEALEEDPPEHLLPCHGEPLSGRARIGQKLRKNAEAIRLLYEETLRLLAKGGSAHDCRVQVTLPDHLREDPELRCLYGEVEHAVLAFAYGETGFWSGETRELVPLHPKEEAQCLAELAGTKGNLLAYAEKAYASDRLAVALHFADAAERLEISGAKELRKSILRKAAGQTPAWTLRNTLLTLAQ